MTDYPNVALEREELLYCAAEGARRYVDTYVLGGAGNRIPGKDSDGKGWTRHIDAACAEYAFHLISGLELTGWGPGGRGKPDVGRCEVRASRWVLEPGYHGLMVDLTDRRGRPLDDERVWVQVVNRCPRFAVVGWIQAFEAREAGEVFEEYGVGRVCVPLTALHAWDRQRVVPAPDELRTRLRSSA